MSELLEDVDHVYTSIASGTIQRYWISDAGFADVSIRLSRLLGDLGDVQSDDLCRRVLSWPRRLRFALSCTPLEYPHALTHCLAPPENLPESVRLFELAYPRFGAVAADLIDRMKRLRDRETNPLLVKVRSLIDAGARTTVLIRDRRHISCVLNALDVGSRGLSVQTAAQLVGLQSFDRIVLVGAVRWYPSFVLTSPRAPHLDIVCHAWIGDRVTVAPIFSEDSAPTGRITPAINEIAPPSEAFPRIRADEVTPSVDVGALVRRAQAESNGERHLEQAHFVELEGDWGVFLAADDESTIFVIEFDADEPHVTQAPVKDLREGAFIVLRTKGSGDYLRNVADSLLGPVAATARADQLLWKHALRQEMYKRGSDAIARVLRKEFGLDRLSVGKMEYWASDRNIAPGEKAVFQRVLLFLGLSERIDQTWQNVVRLRSAHQQAGGEIRDQLLNVIRDADREELDATGIMEFTLPVAGAGKLTAFRVIRVTEGVHEIPSGQVGRPIEAQA
jgi:hypothetical protein